MFPAPMIPMRMLFSLRCLREVFPCPGVRGGAGVAERVEPFHLGGEVVDPVADVAFRLTGPAGRVGERQLPHPGRAPAQPEDLTEFLLTLLQVGDRDPDVPDASHDEPLSGRFVRFYGSSM